MANGNPYLLPWQLINRQGGLLVRNEQRIFFIGSWLLGPLAVGSLAILVGGRMAEQKRRVGPLKAVGATLKLWPRCLLPSTRHSRSEGRWLASLRADSSLRSSRVLGQPSLVPQESLGSV
jgi:hypothetical protein